MNNVLAILKKLVFYQMNKTKNCCANKPNIYHIVNTIIKIITLYFVYDDQLDNKGAIYANVASHFLNAII